MKVVASRYLQIAVDIAAKIADRQYSVGDKVYSRSAIASQYSVSAETARRAVAVLSDMGIVETLKGSGVVIKSYENAMEFVRLNKDTNSIENLKRETMELASFLSHEFSVLRDKVSMIVDRATQLRSTNPFIPYEALVEPSSPCRGKSLNELKFWQSTSATVVAVRRGDALIISPGPYETLQEGDMVYFVGGPSCPSNVNALLQGTASPQDA